MCLKNCELIILPKMGDDRGMLSFAESNKHVPFMIKRIFYMYDIPEAKSRGAHAHKTLHQFIISLAGSFEVELDDGKEKRCFAMDKPWQGLHIPPMIWTSVDKFQNNAVCLVLASEAFDEADYYRNYAEFKAASCSR